MISTKEYGNRNEKDVAFHLHRSLQAENDIHIFNNVKVSAEGDNAQIDHLVLHRRGFIIIESKSIFGNVEVNVEQEWSRSYKSQWYGIPSPIAQADNQIKVLKNFLRQHAPEVLGQVLGLQWTFAGRQYDVLVAISSSAIINRKHMPSNINKMIAKAEFIPDKIKRLINEHKYGALKLSPKPAFSKEQMTNILALLRQQEHEIRQSDEPKQETVPKPKAKASPKPKAKKQESVQAQTPSDIIPADAKDTTALNMQCKHCRGSSGLSPKPGRFGYYVTCGECKKNTPMKSSCPACQSAETKVSKRKEKFTLKCTSCSFSGPIGLAG